MTKKECSICLKYILDDHMVIKTPCNHYYHYKCLSKWFEKKKSCPFCRYDIKNDEISDKLIEETTYTIRHINTNNDSNWSLFNNEPITRRQIHSISQNTNFLNNFIPTTTSNNVISEPPTIYNTININRF